MLQSTNEELETTVEELQSMNSELTTLNAELERRTADLRRAEAFERRVVNAVDEVVFVVDPRLVVTRWNVAVARLWDVPVDAAVGREFSTLPSERLTGVPSAQAAAAIVALDVIPVLSPTGELLGVLGSASDAARVQVEGR